MRPQGATLLVITLVSILIFSGCTWFQKQEEVIPQEEIKIERLTGILDKPIEMDLLTAKSKFVLQTVTGEQLFVDSVNINLRKYQKRNVEVGGQWNADKTVFVVSEVMPLGKENELKTQYQSPVIGIKFTYPTLWALKEDTNVAGVQKIILTPFSVDETEISGVDNIVVERSENNRKLSPQKWLNLDDQYRSGDATDTNMYQESKIGVAQLSAVKKTSGTGAKVELFVNRDIYMYRFSHTTVFDSDKDAYRNAFYELVMGFEFIPFGEVSGTSTPAVITPAVPLPAAPVRIENDGPRPSVPAQPLEPPAITPSPAAQPPPAQPEPAPADLTTVRQSFINYIKENIATLAQEPASAGSWTVKNVEFTYPEGKPEEFNAIYVVYGDSANLRKILLSVADRTSPSSVARIAYFTPGDSVDWVVSDGTDTAKTNDKSFVSVDNVAAEVVVKKGMTLLTARAFKLTIQYPSNWYWASVKDGYAFSDKPVTTDNVLIKLVEAPYWTAENPKPAGFTDVCDATAGKYCLVGAETYKDTMQQMIGTLQQ